MGEVWLAHATEDLDPRLVNPALMTRCLAVPHPPWWVPVWEWIKGVPVALKVMHPHLQDDAKARMRFAREVLAADQATDWNRLVEQPYSTEDSRHHPALRGWWQGTQHVAGPFAWYVPGAFTRDADLETQGPVSGPGLPRVPRRPLRQGWTLIDVWDTADVFRDIRWGTRSRPDIVGPVPGVADSRPWAAYAYLPGHTVADYMRAGPWRPRAAGLLFYFLAQTLEHLEYHGVVHRDIKPSNVVLLHDKAALIDFGIAVGDTDLTRLTTAAPPGTIGYLSPEHARGEAVTTASDMFSAAATAVATVLGRSPFQRNHDVATLYAVLHDDPDLSGLGAFRGREFLVRALDKDPAKRPTPREVVEQAEHDLARTVLVPKESAAERVPERFDIPQDQDTLWAAALNGGEAPAPSPLQLQYDSIYDRTYDSLDEGPYYPSPDVSPYESPYDP